MYVGQEGLQVLVARGELAIGAPGSHVVQSGGVNLEEECILS